MQDSTKIFMQGFYYNRPPVKAALGDIKCTAQGLFTRLTKGQGGEKTWRWWGYGEVGLVLQGRGAIFLHSWAPFIPACWYFHAAGRGYQCKVTYFACFGFMCFMWVDCYLSFNGSLNILHYASALCIFRYVL